jgi:23S rRNA (cytosine1962-C5)-methyltransferase
MQKKAILKPGKEKPILNRHHWIFSGAIENLSLEEPGELLEVFSSSGETLGWGYFNPKCSLIGRMVSFGEEDPYKTIEKNLKNAALLRKNLFSSTNCYRIVNGEGDLLPGLIIDRYGSTLVLQIGTLGMERLKTFIIDSLLKLLPETTSIYEKSSAASRTEEGLEKNEEHLFGKKTEEIEVIENDIKFLVNIPASQKTGLYLDHREMRSFLGSLAEGKEILNCFSYTGGFSAYAAKHKAKKIDTVDSSNFAITYAQKNFEINNFSGNFNFYCSDVFDFIDKNDLNSYDIIILDPPAFAKKRNQIPNASEKYQMMNRDTMKKMKPHSLLFTSSCSYHIDPSTFKNIISSAAKKAGRAAKIISIHRQAIDHPINLFHPESEYLKGFVLEII